MRAALWTGGEKIQNPEMIQKIQTCEFMAAADQGLAHLIYWNFTPNMWVGDGDSYLSDLPPNCQQVHLSRDKNETDTEAAVLELVKLGVQEIWLCGGSGGRMDHWLSNLRLITNCPQITRWFTAYEEVFIPKENTELFLQADTISIFPLGQPPWKIESKGLVWALDSVDFSSWHSLSNRTKEGDCRLKILKGRFMVLIPGAEI